MSPQRFLNNQERGKDELEQGGERMKEGEVEVLEAAKNPIHGEDKSAPVPVLTPKQLHAVHYQVGLGLERDTERVT
eukprot:1392066-Amorphochlora_amoeboformis.AAC.1